jgi:4'-phosphopantetheinyl transferase
MVLDPVWSIPPDNLLLAGDQVHVWRAGLDLPESTIACLRDTLSADEVNRSERFHFPQHRRRFIAARGLLRVMLGRYLEVEPKSVSFCYGLNGKPAVELESCGATGSTTRTGLSSQTRDRAQVSSAGSDPTLQFNLAHSGELALYAFARERQVGVDLERHEQDVAYGEIAQRYFSTREQGVLQSLPAHERGVAFFSCWTRKEAYLKARGDGLSVPLDQFEVTMLPGEPATLLHAAFYPDEVARWSLRELRPGRGYIAALAVKGHNWQLLCWQWPEGGW